MSRISSLKAAIILCPAFMLGGCAYKSTSTFIIRNESSDVITVKTAEEGPDGGEIEFTLEPGRQKALATETKKVPENYIPVDTFDDYDLIPPSGLLKRLEIWVGSAKLSDEVRTRYMWEYFNTDYTERYTLVITDEIIRDYLEIPAGTDP